MATSGRRNFLLTNATVLTMDAAFSRASAVAIRDGVIAGLGNEALTSTSWESFERVDCGGGTLLPAFIDAHCHLLSYAASLRSVDCTNTRSIGEIQELVRARASQSRRGAWIRAFGYEETSLAERRHPTRVDIDSVAPDHPVRLIHRSGHASVLNSAALALAGITAESEEPPGGSIERDTSTGAPNGVLLDMEERIDCSMPRPSYEELRESVREASRWMVRRGIGCIVDTSHTNGRERWDLFERLIADGAIAQEVVLMEGIDHLGEMPERGADGRLRRGAVKIMLHEIGDDLSPGEDDLARLVLEAHRRRRQVAIHAVGGRAVTAAVTAIESVLSAESRLDHRHRIEHCSVLNEDMAKRIAAAGIIVVSQPSFLHERGERYLELVPEDELDRLYAFRTLADAGVPLAAGSDAPVTSPDPLASIASAVNRRSAEGRPIAPDQSAQVEEALRWWTSGAAAASFLEDERGAVKSGLRADLVLLDSDPTICSPHDLTSIGVRELWLSGLPRIVEARDER
jgi:predicted amidohydrolase YtcJ